MPWGGAAALGGEAVAAELEAEAAEAEEEEETRLPR